MWYQQMNRYPPNGRAYRNRFTMDLRSRSRQVNFRNQENDDFFTSDPFFAEELGDDRDNFEDV